jgi:hypothetical protein
MPSLVRSRAPARVCASGLRLDVNDRQAGMISRENIAVQMLRASTMACGET